MSAATPTIDFTGKPLDVLIRENRGIEIKVPLLDNGSPLDDITGFVFTAEIRDDSDAVVLALATDTSAFAVDSSVTLIATDADVQNSSLALDVQYTVDFSFTKPNAVTRSVTTGTAWVEPQ